MHACGSGCNDAVSRQQVIKREADMSGDTGTAESRLYVARFVHRLLRVVAQLLFRVTVSGDVQQLRHAKTLIVANHESFLDGLLLAVFLPIDATFVVHTSIASRPVLGWLLRFIPHLAIDS